MAPRQILTRKSDGLILCNEVLEWSGWGAQYKAPVLETVTGIPYEQPIGVMYEVQELTLRFADDTPQSSENRFWILVNAHRKKQRLTFSDSKGVVSDVFVHQPMTPDTSERWREVRTKDVRLQKCVIRKASYVR